MLFGGRLGKGISGFAGESSEARLEVLKWLHFTFKLTGKDARSVGNYALQLAAENGHLEVLKWLHLTYNLTIEDIKRGNYSVYGAAVGGALNKD